MIKNSAHFELDENKLKLIFTPLALKKQIGQFKLFSSYLNMNFRHTYVLSICWILNLTHFFENLI